MFTPIEQHQLNPDEPSHAVAALVETSGDEDEFLFLTNNDGTDDSAIVLSPQEAWNLRGEIDRWLANVDRGTVIREHQS